MMNLKNLAASVEDRKSEKGFTLIELIIVIAIIGILVAIAIPVYGAIQSNARQKAVDSAAKEVVTAVIAANTDEDTANDGQAGATAIATAYEGDSGKVTVTATVDTATSTVTVDTAYTGQAETGTASGSF